MHGHVLRVFAPIFISGVLLGSNLESHGSSEFQNTFQTLIETQLVRVLDDGECFEDEKVFEDRLVQALENIEQAYQDDYQKILTQEEYLHILHHYFQRFSQKALKKYPNISFLKD